MVRWQGQTLFVGMDGDLDLGKMEADIVGSQDHLEAVSALPISGFWWLDPHPTLHCISNHHVTDYTVRNKQVCPDQTLQWSVCWAGKQACVVFYIG